jgi:hypothetical protein
MTMLQLSVVPRFHGLRTRFEPAADIYASNTTVHRHHLVYEAPIVIDARTKPGFPDELVVREDISKLVDKRWPEYFPLGL